MLRPRAAIEGDRILPQRSAAVGPGRAVVDPDEAPVPIPITDIFDLHSIAPRDVKAAVEAYLERSARAGFRRRCESSMAAGSGCSARRFERFSARTPYVLDFSDAPPEAGGWGATIVTLQRG